MDLIIPMAMIVGFFSLYFLLFLGFDRFTGIIPILSNIKILKPEILYNKRLAQFIALQY